MYDYIIVGAGPAGATLARLINNKYKVLIIDRKSSYQKGKCCGGLLNPTAQKELSKQGLGLPKDILVNPQVFGVEVLDLYNNLSGLYQKCYINFDRELFDKWLISLIPENVSFTPNTLFKYFTEKKDYLEVDIVANGVPSKLKTKFLIGADGANSKVRSLLSKNNQRPKNYISIQEWYASSTTYFKHFAIFDESITDFYAWIIPKDNFLILGAALDPSKDVKKIFSSLKSKIENKGIPLGECIKREGAFIERPTKLKQITTGYSKAMLIGEAGGFISPSSAEGISYALKSARFLADSINKDSTTAFKDYSKKAKKLKLYILSKIIKSPPMFNPQIRRLAISSKLQRIDK